MSAKPKIDRAALEVFTHRGFDAATTREIAATAGVSEGAIYRHYKGKEELAVDLFLSLHKRMSTLIQDASAAAPDFPSKVRAVVESYCTVADEDWLLFTFHLLSLHRFLPHYEEDGRDPVSVVARLIKIAQAMDECPPGDPDLLAAMALGVVTQTAQNKAYGRIRGTMTDHAPALSTAVLAVLTTR